jgi:hypothetical protein
LGHHNLLPWWRRFSYREGAGFRDIRSLDSATPFVSTGLQRNRTEINSEWYFERRAPGEPWRPTDFDRGCNHERLRANGTRYLDRLTIAA